MQTASPELDGFHGPKGGATATLRPEPDLAAAVLGSIGPLQVRLARDETEIAAAQEVRYRVFFDELGAKGSFGQRDSDRFDAVCDHLLVFDTSLTGPEHRRIVGTYRLLRQEHALAAGGFYSEDEFELGKLIARLPSQSFLELGRSCVLPEYRSKRTIELLWQGIWAYVRHYRIGVMAGCASFHGAVPAAHAEALSYMAHHCRASSEFDVRAVPERYRSMDLMPAEAIKVKSAALALPPLIKGYLRVGAKVGDGCVVDHAFGTVDVFMVMPIQQIAKRYISYYGGEAHRFAA